MIPAHHVVAGPHGAQAVRAREESTCQHEGSYRRGPEELALNTGHVVVEAVDVVNVAVLDVVAGRMALVQVVARHRDLGAVEDAGLVHVIPSIQIHSVVRVVVQGEELGPLIAHVGVAEVRVERRTRPAPTVVLLPALRLREEVQVLQLFVDVITLVLLDVRVDDRHQLSLVDGQRVQKFVRLREVRRMPSEVLLRVRVLDVQPQHVVGYVVLVELRVDADGIGGVHIVPPGLVLA
mmetsp:Transcript_2072/g.8074  ORF Transcript_2072/g.8074 Transcript_2072/m.8074 type:complete len:236 (+) Transcript_2072:1067-1774(+)